MSSYDGEQIVYFTLPLSARRDSVKGGAALLGLVSGALGLIIAVIGFFAYLANDSGVDGEMGPTIAITVGLIFVLIACIAFTVEQSIKAVLVEGPALSPILQDKIDQVAGVRALIEESQANSSAGEFSREELDGAMLGIADAVRDAERLDRSMGGAVSLDAAAEYERMLHGIDERVDGLMSVVVAVERKHSHGEDQGIVDIEDVRARARARASSASFAEAIEAIDDFQEYSEDLDNQDAGNWGSE